MHSRQAISASGGIHRPRLKGQRAAGLVTMAWFDIYSSLTQHYTHFGGHIDITEADKNGGLAKRDFYRRYEAVSDVWAYRLKSRFF